MQTEGVGGKVYIISPFQIIDAHKGGGEGVDVVMAFSLKRNFQ